MFQILKPGYYEARYSADSFEWFIRRRFEMNENIPPVMFAVVSAFANTPVFCNREYIYKEAQ